MAAHIQHTALTTRVHEGAVDHTVEEFVFCPEISVGHHGVGIDYLSERGGIFVRVCSMEFRGGGGGGRKDEGKSQEDAV